MIERWIPQSAFRLGHREYWQELFSEPSQFYRGVFEKCRGRRGNRRLGENNRNLDDLDSGVRVSPTLV